MVGLTPAKRAACPRYMPAAIAINIFLARSDVSAVGRPSVTVAGGSIRCANGTTVCVGGRGASSSGMGCLMIGHHALPKVPTSTFYLWSNTAGGVPPFLEPIWTWEGGPLEA